MAFSLQKALDLVNNNTPRSEYQCNHVVNAVLNGNKNLGGLAAGYLHYGSKVDKPSAGTVVVSKNGTHVGIFINEREFIHSSSHEKKVIKVNLTQLPFVFPMGYELRK
jgi:cell wall-associated NlpC family hydrolase